MCKRSEEGAEWRRRKASEQVAAATRRGRGSELRRLPQCSSQRSAKRTELQLDVRVPWSGSRAAQAASHVSRRNGCFGRAGSSSSSSAATLRSLLLHLPSMYAPHASTLAQCHCAQTAHEQAAAAHCTARVWDSEMRQRQNRHRLPSLMQQRRRNTPAAIAAGGRTNQCAVCARASCWMPP